MVTIAACETAAGLKKDLSHASNAASDAASSLDGSTPKHYAPVTFSGEPDIRVRIAKAVTKKEIGGPTNIVVRPTQTSPASKSKVMKAPVTITSSAAGIAVVDAVAVRQTWPVGTDLEIAPSEGAPGETAPAPTAQPLRMDKQRFPGTLTIRQGSKEASTRFDVIAAMPLETY